MCEILGFIGHQDIVPDMLNGLSQIEDKGFSSVAMTIITQSGRCILKQSDNLSLLRDQANTSGLSGVSGIGHGRRDMAPLAKSHATILGINAEVAVVLHGTIENMLGLQHWLETEGMTFSDNPSAEILPALVCLFLRRGYDPEQSLNRAIERVHGTFSIAVMFRADPHHIYAAHRGNPLVIGVNDQGAGIASDLRALGSQFTQLLYLHDGDQAQLSTNHILIRDQHGRKTQRQWLSTSPTPSLQQQDCQAFYLNQEIHDQPEAVSRTLQCSQPQLQVLPEQFFEHDRITIIGSGSSYHAALMAKSWLEMYTGLPVDALLASEFPYGPPLLKPGGLTLILSQSGETDDSLQSLRYAREQQQHILAIVNVAGSRIGQEADHCIETSAGPEISTVATKSFSCQLTVLACLVIKMALKRQTLEISTATRMHQLLFTLPTMMKQIIANEAHYLRIGQLLSNYKNLLLTGHGCSYPLALEGALKLKEICYVHAEGIAAGELKHGSIALLKTNTPILVMAIQDERTPKILTDMLHVCGASIKPLLLGDHTSLSSVTQPNADKIELPDTSPIISPILHTIVLQLIAYHAALAKGTDVDRSRNLAKSVINDE